MQIGASCVNAEFPEMKLAYIQSDLLPEVAAQNRVFTAPTILVFFEGREYIRKSRTVGLSELQNEISRVYSVLFG
uniref:thioredoxin family protein n=1 Tax=uncultured Draconibacterium sp. TaxID=1573823 RepID=UPI003216B42D